MVRYEINSVIIRSPGASNNSRKLPLTDAERRAAMDFKNVLGDLKETAEKIGGTALADAEELKDKAVTAAKDKKIDEKIKDGAAMVEGKVKEILDRTEIDEKIKEGAAKAEEKVKEVLEKTDIDEKIKEGAAKAEEKVREVLDKFK